MHRVSASGLDTQEREESAAVYGRAMSSQSCLRAACIFHWQKGSLSLAPSQLRVTRKQTAIVELKEQKGTAMPPWQLAGSTGKRQDCARVWQMQQTPAWHL